MYLSGYCHWVIINRLLKKKNQVIVRPSEVIIIGPFHTMPCLMICQYTAHLCESVNSNYINNCSWTVNLAKMDHYNCTLSWRRKQIDSLSFSLIGNKFTLETRPSKDGIDIRQELLKFHSTYYSSNLMGLCVLGRGKNSLMFKCCKRFTLA